MKKESDVRFEGSEWVRSRAQWDLDLGTSPRQPASKRVGSPTSTTSYAENTSLKGLFVVVNKGK